MRRVFILLIAIISMMSCKDRPITMNLYYTGENGNARKFVEEMESCGTADAHHVTPMMKTISSLREKYDLTTILSILGNKRRDFADSLITRIL